jgi:hypothetical protein
MVRSFGRAAGSRESFLSVRSEWAFGKYSASS